VSQVETAEGYAELTPEESKECIGNGVLGVCERESVCACACACAYRYMREHTILCVCAWAREMHMYPLCLRVYVCN